MGEESFEGLRVVHRISGEVLTLPQGEGGFEAQIRCSESRGNLTKVILPLSVLIICLLNQFAKPLHLVGGNNPGKDLENKKILLSC